ncbi:Gfo/Idh/MocA family protein [Ruania halotolerans]|uniref:Gfo/Idh/MocA family protein n=1 Tax=Ruania halotolerans TaxID=2897773 RepID=UPI001E64C62E|nr:Gfo/Idh/MocA family oxidoreductase [Ruania halotolerans]UFU06445.1 Gfo/Idh/MocA family oxidoreductase [Ruania halotolerans]
MNHPEPLRVGLIGAGGIAGVHAPAWHSLGADLVVHSLHGGDALAQQYGASTAASLDDLWPQVDVVDIITPTATHAEIALAAIAAGKHVVCEKPLARTAAQAQQIVDSARNAGVRLFPAHVVRYFPAYAAAYAAVQAGRIGQVAVSRFRRMSAAPAAPWFFDEAVSGGIVMDQMIHDLDQAAWISGAVTEVFARSITRADDGVRTASATVTLTHSSGAISHVYGVWGHAHLPFSSSFEIAGSEGVLRHDSARDDAVRLALPPTPEVGGYLPAVDVSTSPYTAEIEDFVRVIRAGGSAQVSGNDGVTAVRLAEAANESIRTGAVVALSATFDAAPAEAEEAHR